MRVRASSTQGSPVPPFTVLFAGPVSGGAEGRCRNRKAVGTLWALPVVRQAHLPKPRDKRGGEFWDSGSRHQKLKLFSVDSIWVARILGPKRHMLSSQVALISELAANHMHDSLLPVQPPAGGGQPSTRWRRTLLEGKSSLTSKPEVLRLLPRQQRTHVIPATSFCWKAGEGSTESPSVPGKVLKPPEFTREVVLHKASSPPACILGLIPLHEQLASRAAGEPAASLTG